jgi:hypothetical protein
VESIDSVSRVSHMKVAAWPREEKPPTLPKTAFCLAWPLSSPTSEPQLNIHQSARPCYVCRKCTMKIYGVTYFALLISQSSEVDCCIQQQSMQRLRMVPTREPTKYSHIAECIPTFEPEYSNLRPRILAEKLTL